MDRIESGSESVFDAATNCGPVGKTADVGRADTGRMHALKKDLTSLDWANIRLRRRWNDLSSL